MREARLKWYGHEAKMCRRSSEEVREVRCSWYEEVEVGQRSTTVRLDMTQLQITEDMT